jgi:hypothetical protein
MNESVNGPIEVVARRLPMFIWVTGTRMVMSQACKIKTDENHLQKVQLVTVLAHNHGAIHACGMLEERLPVYRS